MVFFIISQVNFNSLSGRLPDNLGEASDNLFRFFINDNLVHGPIPKSGKVEVSKP